MEAAQQRNLTTDNRLYSRVVTSVSKLNGPTEVVVVGDGQCSVAKVDGLPY